MKSMLLACGVLAAFAATGAMAGPAKKAMSTPSQPVPYSMLDAYLKASPAKRQAMMANASSGAMQTDAAATAPATATDSAAAAPSGTTSGAAEAGSTSAPSDSAPMPPGPVNPTTSMTPTDSGAATPSTGSATSPSTSDATSPTKK